MYDIKYSNTENMVFLRHKSGSLSWEIVFTDYLEMVMDYLEIECGFENSEDYTPLFIVRSDAVISGKDWSDKAVW